MPAANIAKLPPFSSFNCGNSVCVSLATCEVVPVGTTYLSGTTGVSGVVGTSGTLGFVGSVGFAGICGFKP